MLKKINSIKYVRHIVCIIRCRKKMEQCLNKDNISFKKYCVKIDEHLTSIIDILSNDGDVDQAARFRKKQQMLHRSIKDL